MSEEKNRLVFNDVLSRAAAEKEHKVYVEELGGYVPYKDLTIDDFEEIMKKQGDAVGMSKLALFKAWHKADPTVTMEGINRIPARIVLGIINEIGPVLFGTTPLGTSRSTPGRTIYLLKKLGFTVDEIRGMTWAQACFWLESMAYDAELMNAAVEEGGRKETRSLDDLAVILPKTKGEERNVQSEH